MASRITAIDRSSSRSSRASTPIKPSSLRGSSTSCAATPEGDGNLLDHSLFLYGASLSNPNLHAHYDLPLTLVGGAAGRLAGGRHLVYPAETPMTNLLLAMLDKVEVPTESLGDSTDRLDLEPLSV